jgi:hypothetical protein
VKIKENDKEIERIPWSRVLLEKLAVHSAGQ